MHHQVALRSIALADQHVFVASARSSIKLHRPWVTAPTTAEAFAGYLARFDNEVHYGFAVELPATGELVGAIHLTHVVRGPFCSGYLGYYAFAGDAGRGLMKQGLLKLMRHAFTNLRLHRLEANIQPGNTASRHLVRACGFRQEGYSPAYLKIGGRWRDHERWGVVRGIRST